MAEVVFDEASRIYTPGAKPAVDRLSLTVADGDLVVLVGPSGSGKSTALRMLAGLEPIDAGSVRINGRDVVDVQPKDRDIAMVFQNYALYPSKTVAENMAFPLKMRGMEKEERGQRVREAAEMLGLTEYLDRKPKALSGGQRQRVAMGRAIVREPQVFLMDEPLSNLDAKMRVQTRAQIAEMQNRLAVSTVYVTHDQVEAMTMGDRVAVMRKGELQQVAPPQELYDHPVNLFVGGFIGSPAMNLVEATLSAENGSLRAEAGGQTLTLASDLLDARPDLKGYEGKDVVLGIRPENLEDAALASDTPSDRRLRGKVELTEALGSEVMVHFTVDAPPALTDDVRELAQDVGDERRATGEAEEHTTMVGRFDAHSKVQEGETAEVAVDTRSLHFFDPETGLGIYGNDKAKGA